MASIRRSTRCKPPSQKTVCSTLNEQITSERKTAKKSKKQEVVKSADQEPADSSLPAPACEDTTIIPPQLQEMADDCAVGCGQGVWSKYKELFQRLPGRQEQLKLLLLLFGELSSPTPSPLYLYGNTGTGKTLTIKTLLETLAAPHVLVNCVECYSSRVLFESILGKLAWESSGLLKPERGGRCESVCGFVRGLQQLIRGDDLLPTQTVYIVLDRAERLRDLEVTVLPAMIRLRELSGCNVCVVMVSELPFEKLSTDSAPNQVLPIHFADYSKAETLAIMALDRDPEDSLEIYTTFCSHIWNVFHIVCRDLGELRHLSSVLYPKYKEPVSNGLIGCHETRKLWKHIEPFFKDVLSRVYLRELSTNQGERALATPTNSFGDVTDYLELPYYSKFLLFSSFLASYNPARSDRKFFSKTKQGNTRKSHRPTLKEKPNHQLLGPKPFPLDRLMAIFYSILEEDVPPAAHLYSQVASLVTLQLLAQISSADSLDSPKYKCLLTLEHVRRVARSVGFDIVQYLYDFN